MKRQPITFSKRPRILLTHNTRLEHIVSCVENSDSFTIQKTPEGYRAYTDSSTTGICDTPLQAIDESYKDESFH